MSYPFQSIDWANIKKEEHKGSSGTSYWQTLQLPGLRIRIVEYSPNYVADHWCEKGHIVHCLEGGFTSRNGDGSMHELKAGISYVVSDKQSSHMSISETGARLLIVDGDFLKSQT
jgi:hypothetical protein